VARSRILVLVKGLGIGGAEKLITEGARFWDRDSLDYLVGYVLPWKDALVPDLKKLGIEVLMLGDPRGMTVRFPGRLRRVVRSRHIDLIHAHLPTMGITARIASPVPVVYTEHNVTNSYHPATRALSRATYARNRALIAVSDAVADSVVSWPGPKPEVIRNGVSVTVDPDAAISARGELGIGEKSALIAHVGNIRPGKGHDNLIEAVADLASRRSDFLVVSIGVEKHDGDLDRVRTKAEQANLTDRIRFLGRRQDALSFVAASDVFVNPSEVEGLPVAVLEAMALGRPVVATAAGGVPTIVRDGETGLLVETSDPLALAKGIERLLDDRPLAARLGEAARDLVDSEYSLQPMIRATEDVYRRVLDD
jgi:glycosyltransferase involved in cell wall biosynthesis